MGIWPREGLWFIFPNANKVAMLSDVTNAINSLKLFYIYVPRSRSLVFFSKMANDRSECTDSANPNGFFFEL